MHKLCLRLGGQIIGLNLPAARLQRQHHVNLAVNVIRLSSGTIHKDSPSRELSSESSDVNLNKDDPNLVTVNFLKPDGQRITVKTCIGKSLYDTVIDNNVDIDGFGACEGTLCCTTCHLIFSQSDYAKVGAPSDEELDMLDLAYGLTETSRLGCQVILRKELDPLEVQVPASISDVRES